MIEQWQVGSLNEDLISSATKLIMFFAILVSWYPSMMKAVSVFRSRQTFQYWCDIYSRCSSFSRTRDTELFCLSRSTAMGTLGSLCLSIWRPRGSFKARETHGSGICFRYDHFIIIVFPIWLLCLDPPIKRFAQRHMYLGIDAIADRDLGFAMARKATATSTLGWARLNNRSLVWIKARNEWRRLIIGTKEKITRGGSGGSADFNGQGSKRMRPSSPPPRGVDRDREMLWEGPSSRRRPFSPPPPTSSWDRDDRPRAREPLPPSRAQKNLIKFEFLLLYRGSSEIYLLLLHLMVNFSTLYFWGVAYIFYCW